MQYQKHTLSEEISFDSIIHMAQNYGKTLDYCWDNSLMLYVFRYNQTKSMAVRVRTDLDEVIVEADWEYLKAPYKYVYSRVMDLKEALLNEVQPWGGKEELVNQSIQAYIPYQDTRLYWYMNATGAEVRQISDLLTVLKSCVVPGDFADYLNRYDIIFIDVIRWVREELRHILLGEGKPGGGTSPLPEHQEGDGSNVNQGNFCNKIITNNFKIKVLSELGIDLNQIKIIFNWRQTPNANAGYNSSDNTIYISDNMFLRNWTEIDMESIIYHECVHARQFLIEGIILQKLNGEIVTHEYVVPVTWFSVRNAWNELYNILDVNNIPRNAELRDQNQEIIFQYYKSQNVDPVLAAYEKHETIVEKYNKEQVRMEVEAYGKQLEKYGNVMSIKQLEDVQIALRSWESIWKMIKEQ